MAHPQYRADSVPRHDAAPAPTARPADEYPASAGHPAEGPASGAAGLAADAAPGAQADPSAGPGSLFYAIRAWHARHPDFVAVLPCVIPVPDGTLRARRTIQERRWAAAALRLGIPFATYRANMLAGNRWCSFHQRFQPGGEFPLSHGTTYCREGGRLYQRQRRSA